MNKMFFKVIHVRFFFCTLAVINIFVCNYIIHSQITKPYNFFHNFFLLSQPHIFNTSYIYNYVGECTTEVIKLFSCSAQLRLKFILLINVKMPTSVGILTFISRINYRI